MTYRTFTDQLGRQVRLPFPPQRIISLVPSQTELLHDLGLGERVVGITKFCIHPQEWFRTKARVGGTKDVRPEVVRSLCPDLIIANREENEQAQIEALAQEFPVWVSDVDDLPSALKMISSISGMTDTAVKGEELVSTIAQLFENLRPGATRTAVYLIWKGPYMAAGPGTFIHDMMHRCGLQNAVAALRYPQLTVAQLQALDPELVLLSSEPYPFKEEHLEELRAILPNATVMLVDGEPFSWYGSRMLHSPDYFRVLMGGWGG